MLGPPQQLAVDFAAARDAPLMLRKSSIRRQADFTITAQKITKQCRGTGCSMAANVTNQVLHTQRAKLARLVVVSV